LIGENKLDSFSESLNNLTLDEVENLADNLLERAEKLKKEPESVEYLEIKARLRLVLDRNWKLAWE
jgi:hypothetical protein